MGKSHPIRLFTELLYHFVRYKYITNSSRITRLFILSQPQLSSGFIQHTMPDGCIIPDKQRNIRRESSVKLSISLSGYGIIHSGNPSAGTFSRYAFPNITYKSPETLHESTMCVFPCTAILLSWVIFGIFISNTLSEGR